MGRLRPRLRRGENLMTMTGAPRSDIGRGTTGTRANANANAREHQREDATPAHVPQQTHLRSWRRLDSGSLVDQTRAAPGTAEHAQAQARWPDWYGGQKVHWRPRPASIESYGMPCATCADEHLDEPDGEDRTRDAVVDRHVTVLDRDGQPRRTYQEGYCLEHAETLGYDVAAGGTQQQETSEKAADEPASQAWQVSAGGLAGRYSAEALVAAGVVGVIVALIGTVALARSFARWR